MAEPTKAVFLSYAREDTDAARRIADALRSQGVEVWFDQAELRGGEAWDAKIKKQIRECALFLAVVSANTQERTEGYFRREWKLAVERTADMAAGMAFIVPVVVDDTAEAQAVVPDEFMRVQWTRLPGALPTPEFVAQVKNLLGGGRRRPTIAPMATSQTAAPMRTRPPMTALPPPPPKPAAAAVVDESAPEKKKSGRRTGRWIGLLVVLLAAGAGAYLFLAQPEPAPPPPKPVVAAKPKPAPAASAVGDKSIAVLPFENMSEDKDASAFFSDGIHEDILTNLAHIRELRVVSRTSVMEYRGKTENIREIAKKLGVAYILEGSVRRSGNKVRVTGQLILAATDEHVWAETMDRDLSDVFAIQSELAQKIASSLQAALSPQEKKLLSDRPTESTEAYDLYLKARAELRNGSAGGGYPSELRQESLLQAAVTLDPNFALGWAQLTIVHADIYNLNYEHSEARLAKARVAIETAIRLAPDSPEVIRSLGEYYFHGYRDFVSATTQYEKLIRLQPNDPNVYSGLGFVQRRQGKWPEAAASFRKALQLDPGDNRVMRNGIVTTLENGRNYVELAKWRRRLTELHPENLGEAYRAAFMSFAGSGSGREMEAFFAELTGAQADSAEGLALRRDWADVQGNLEEAIRLEQQLGSAGDAFAAAIRLAAHGDVAAARLKLEKQPADLRSRLEREPANAAIWSQLGMVEAVLGHRDEALRCARKAVELIPESLDAFDGPRYRSQLAFVYAWTGDKDRAIEEYAHLLRSPCRLNVFEMKHNPACFPLRGDPRFQALLNDSKNNEPLF